jgi:N-acetylmuramic acid 6-phosphate etherase
LTDKSRARRPREGGPRRAARSAARRPPAVFGEIAALATEAVNPRTRRIDEASTEGILRLLNREDLSVAPAVRRELRDIARAVEIVVRSLRGGGRVFYVGAGTSGRLGIIDAAECPPTFGTPPELFQGIIAGGPRAVFRAQEGSEDRREEAPRALRRRRVTSKDVVVGLAACKRTPFVVAALEEARRLGAPTVYITCNPLPLAADPAGTGVADVVIAVDVGPEALMGSTRMKSGTAEKMVLNMISTASMIKLGKVYGNLMVDLRATSEKLRHRSVRIIMLATGCSYDEAVRVLKAAQGSVKAAIVMVLHGATPSQALALLARADGSVKRALKLRAARARSRRASNTRGGR